jgi:hypothetical protein
VLDPLSRPRTGEPVSCEADPDAEPNAEPGAAVDLAPAGSTPTGLAAQGDDRTLVQRQHDALAEIVGLALRADTLPSQGGLPASVYLTIGLQDLEQRVSHHLDTPVHAIDEHGQPLNQTDGTDGIAELGSDSAGLTEVGRDEAEGGGYALTSRGQELTVTQLLRIASDAQLIPVVLDRSGVPLDVGFEYRHATPTIRHALTVRDKGCCFPGCTVPPQWCEAHHVIPWWARRPDQPRGPTKVNNLALLCTYHHHIFEQWGWMLHIVNGLPSWTPPTSYDPAQTPIRNTANHQAIINIDNEQCAGSTRPPD